MGLEVGVSWASAGSAIEFFQPVPLSPGRHALRLGLLPGEDPPPDRRSSGIGELLHLFFQLLLDRLGGADGSPFALAEVGPAVVAQADDVDLGGLGPVLAEFEGGGDP